MTVFNGGDSEYGGDVSAMKYTLSFKCDLETQTAILEYANILTGGNTGKLLRNMVNEWQQRINIKDDSPDAKFRQAQFKRRKLEDLRCSLQLEWIKLQNRYDLEFEKICQELSEKNGLEWPPANVKRSEADPNLRRIMDRTRRLWQEKDGIVSFRDLHRSLSSFSPEELIKHLTVLHDERDIVYVPGDRADSFLIIRPT